ncbi:unnamed protein product [Lampetra fluviatilis]
MAASVTGPPFPVPPTRSEVVFVVPWLRLVAELWPRVSATERPPMEGDKAAVQVRGERGGGGRPHTGNRGSLTSSGKQPL